MKIIETHQQGDGLPLTTSDLLAFAKEYLVPVIRYTADKKGYIFDQESKYYTGMDKDDFDDWAKSRAKLAVEKWDAILEANDTADLPATVDSASRKDVNAG